MKASELIQKLLELTQEAGKDLEVVTDYEQGIPGYASDGYSISSQNPHFLDIYSNDILVKWADLDETKEVIVIS